MIKVIFCCDKCGRTGYDVEDDGVGLGSEEVLVCQKCSRREKFSFNEDE